MLNSMPDFPNEYEADGIRQMTQEYNLEQKEYIEKKNGRTLEEIGNLPMMSRDLIGLFMCSECGLPIELSALRFFKFDVEKAKCFKCQGLHFK